MKSCLLGAICAAVFINIGTALCKTSVEIPILFSKSLPVEKESCHAKSMSNVIVAAPDVVGGRRVGGGPGCVSQTPDLRPRQAEPI